MSRHRSMFGRAVALLVKVGLAAAASCAIATAAIADPPDPWRSPAADTVAWFETSGVGYGMVTPDFDCQGLSAGVLQWNVGKGSLWNSLLKPVAESVFQAAMPVHGEDFRDALQKSKNERLSYVRNFQKFADSGTCDGNKRGAQWKGEAGKTFAKEVRALLQTPDVVVRQKAGLESKLDAGWNYAAWWATAKRGPNSTPTYLEFVTFTDTLNFNGRWTESANYALVKAMREGRTDADVRKEILDYLAAAPTGQYQRKEARNNAALWRDMPLNDEQLDLLCFAYLVATNITKEAAKPFKLNTLSRRGAIIFGDGWVNGTRKAFPAPSGS